MLFFTSSCWFQIELFCIILSFFQTPLFSIARPFVNQVLPNEQNFFFVPPTKHNFVLRTTYQSMSPNGCVAWYFLFWNVFAYHLAHVYVSPVVVGTHTTGWEPLLYRISETKMCPVSTSLFWWLLMTLYLQIFHLYLTSNKKDEKKNNWTNRLQIKDLLKMLFFVF